MHSTRPGNAENGQQQNLVQPDGVPNTAMVCWQNPFRANCITKPDRNITSIDTAIGNA